MREVYAYTRLLTVLWVGGTCCLRAVTTVVLLLFSPLFQIFSSGGLTTPFQLLATAPQSH